MPEHAVVATDRATTGSRWQVDRWFYIGVALFMILLNAAAFGPSLVTSTERLEPFTWLVASHGVVSLAFLLLFLTQATLVATGRTSIIAGSEWSLSCSQQ